MKKILTLILTLCMCLFFTIGLTACTFGTTDPEHTHTYKNDWSYDDTHHWYTCEDESCLKTSQKDEHDFENNVCTVCEYKKNNQTTELQTMDCSYDVYSAPMGEKLNVMNSVSENESNYYLIDLGYATNVPIWSGTSMYYNSAMSNPPKLSFSKGSQTQSTVEHSVSQTIENTVSTISTGSASFEVGVELFGIKLTPKVSYSRQWGTTTDASYSTTDAFTTAESVADSFNTAIEIETGGLGYGYYRLSMLATCDIYALLETNYDNTETVKITYTTCPRDKAALTIVYSEDNSWVDTSTTKICLPGDYLSMLELPQDIMIDGTIIDDRWVSSNFSEKLVDMELTFTNHTTEVNYSNSSMLEISIPSKYIPLLQRGKLGIEYNYICDSSLQYRSADSSAIAKIEASINEDDYSEVLAITADGGGWPALWVDPGYGELRSQSSSITKKLLVVEDSLVVNIYVKCTIQFEEFSNWAGGTHAINFIGDFSNLTYRFYVYN